MTAILGQHRALQTLQAALRSGRMHHAWVFCGPKGVGKFTTAVELATIVLDPGARPDEHGALAADPAGETARLIAAGTHPDLHIIRKELALHSEIPGLRTKKLTNIPLDLLRERMIGGWINGKEFDAPVYHTPVRGHGRVFIIDEAELLDQETQNALLKTLEEPPRATCIILVTDDPDRLRPTIRSRCQMIRFTPLDEAAMTAWLARSGLRLDDARRTWIESFAEGSPGRATLAAEYDLYTWYETLAPMLALLERGVFPPTLGATLAELVEAFAEAWVKRHRSASKDAANKDGARLMLSLLAADLRQRLAAATRNGREPAGLLATVELLAEAERQMESNVNLKLLLENLVAQWCTAMAAAA
jgi:hypothetical protein